MVRWLDRARAQYTETVLAGDPVVRQLLEEHYDADVALRPESDSARYKIGLMELVLREMGAVTERAGVPMVLLIIPSPIDVCDDWDQGRIDRAAFPRYRQTNIADVLVGIAERGGLAYVNLFPSYREHGASELYLRHGNDHWNDAGQDLAARLTAREAVDAGLLR